MNERIKQLEIQCWEPRQYGPAWFNSTKFAELILKECIDVADDYVKDCLCEEHIKCNHPRSKIGIKIKERFGIPL